MIYFVQSLVGGPVKIGYAIDPSKRLRELQCGSPFPLRLLRTEEGGFADERALHKQFGHLRLHGEWFQPSAELAGRIGCAQYMEVAPPVERTLHEIVAPSRGVLPLHGPLSEVWSAVHGVLYNAAGQWMRTAEIRRAHPLLLAGSASAPASAAKALMRRGWPISGRLVDAHHSRWTEFRHAPIAA